ncbi:hypothetical protein REIS_0331 [Rickettsia endosymbiont of Ixodes scapularis]|nr:hypothetical protein REIS_0331 [Rickettsia endosymbiont of Ixodes scapularis]
MITLYEMTSKIIETNNEEQYSTPSVNKKDGSDNDIKIYDF